ncbi:MAG: hypothetical protein GY814_04275, partial [Gammaproteobacteria bacterium]|nr:hypothetical protein [Gammaproteobacteria bacterium]
ASVEFKIDAVGLERCLFNIPVRPSVSEWDTIAIHLSSAGVLKFQRGDQEHDSSVVDFDAYLGLENTSVLTFADNYINGYFNNNAVLVDEYEIESEFISAETYLFIGSDAGTSNWINGNIKKLSFYDVAIGVSL